MQTAFGNLAESMNRSARGSSGAPRGCAARHRHWGSRALAGVGLGRSSAAEKPRQTSGARHRRPHRKRDHHVCRSSRGRLPDAPAGRALLSGGGRAAAGRAGSGAGGHCYRSASSVDRQWRGNESARGWRSWCRVRFKRVDPGYFRAWGFPCSPVAASPAGTCDGTPRVMVINEALAARLAAVAGVKNPVGMTVRVSCPGYVEKTLFMPEVQIAGVIRNERVTSPGSPDPPVVYVPLAQVPSPQIKLLVRTRNEARGRHARDPPGDPRNRLQLAAGRCRDHGAGAKPHALGRQPAGVAHRRLRRDRGACSPESDFTA